MIRITFADEAPHFKVGDRCRRRIPGSLRTTVEAVSDCRRFVLVKLTGARGARARWVDASEMQPWGSGVP